MIDIKFGGEDVLNGFWREGYLVKESFKERTIYWIYSSIEYVDGRSELVRHEVNPGTLKLL